MAQRSMLMRAAALLVAALCFPPGNLAAQTSPPQGGQAQVTNVPILDVNLPVNTFEVKDLVRRINGKIIPLEDFVSRIGIIVKFRATVFQSDIDYLGEHFGLKVVQVAGLPANVRFFAFEGDVHPAEVVNTIGSMRSDEQTKFISSVSPVFRFDDGSAYTEDSLVIEWAPGVSKERAVALAERFRLTVSSFNEETHVMVAKTTAESGWNVFRLAYLLGPDNGNPFTVSVEPLWVRIMPPLTTTARVEPDDGFGRAGDIVGSAFRFILEIHARKHATVDLDELKVASSELQRWFPRRMNAKGKFEAVSTQVFDLEGPEVISEPVPEKGGGTITTVVYRFRVWQAGTFRLAPPKVFYEYFDEQMKQVTHSEYAGGSPAEFIVGTVLPNDAVMVNDVVEPQKPRVPLHAFEKAKLATMAGFALSALGALLVLFVASTTVHAHMRAKRTATGSIVSAIDRWQGAMPTLLTHLPHDPEQFWKSFAHELRAALGVYVRGDERAFNSLRLDDVKAECLHAFSEATLGEEIFTLYEDAYHVAHGREDPRGKEFSREDGTVLVRDVREKFATADHVRRAR